MACGCLHQWAIGIVEWIIDQEAAEVSLKDSSSYLLDKDVSWNFVLNFSMNKILSLLES